MEPQKRLTKNEIEELMKDREAFNRLIYTPFEEALTELSRRKKEPIPVTITIPEVLKGDPHFVIFRHIATPNYEIRRFMSAADAADFKPLILEYTSDVFLSLNPWKYSLSKVPFYKGTDKTGSTRIEYKNIIDFNKSNNKPFSEIKTLWDQDLVEFHHEFFLKHFPNHRESVFDLSQWLKQNGSDAKGYYKAFLSLFLNNTILFENFLLEGQELPFTRDVIIPAFVEIMNETGKKPLIVALEPSDIEDDIFWLCHPHAEKEYVASKGKASKKSTDLPTAPKIMQ